MAMQFHTTTPTRTGFRRLAALTAGSAALALTLAAGSALAQQAAQPAAPAKPAAPKPAAPAPAAPAPAAPAPAAPAAPAQAAPAQAGAQDLPAGMPNPWVKICSKDASNGKDTCVIAQELATQGRFLASVAIREYAGDPKKTLIIAIPPMKQIQDGVGVVIDKMPKAEAGKYTICMPNACFAEVAISDAFMGAMKTGGELRVMAISVPDNKRVEVPFSLKGFKIAYDGAGFNPTAEKAKQDALQEETNKRAEEMRKKLGEQPKP